MVHVQHFRSGSRSTRLLLRVSGDLYLVHFVGQLACGCKIERHATDRDNCAVLALCVLQRYRNEPEQDNSEAAAECKELVPVEHEAPHDRLCVRLLSTRGEDLEGIQPGHFLPHAGPYLDCNACCLLGSGHLQ